MWAFYELAKGQSNRINLYKISGDPVINFDTGAPNYNFSCIHIEQAICLPVDAANRFAAMVGLTELAKQPGSYEQCDQVFLFDSAGFEEKDFDTETFVVNGGRVYAVLKAEKYQYDNLCLLKAKQITGSSIKTPASTAVITQISLQNEAQNEL